MFLVDTFVAGASKTQKEFSQVFITKIEFLGGITRIKILKHNKNKKNMQKYYSINILTLKIPRPLGATIPLRQATFTD